MKSFVTLLKNELKLNIRNMNMVIFAVIIPLVVLIILGFIYGSLLYHDRNLREALWYRDHGILRSYLRQPQQPYVGAGYDSIYF